MGEGGERNRAEETPMDCYLEPIPAVLLSQSTRLINCENFVATRMKHKSCRKMADQRAWGGGRRRLGGCVCVCVCVCLHGEVGATAVRTQV